ncbi:MAG: hypothetical protein Ct9H300mP9_2850 [Candidatus Neomarinimicrobiota bacterium]|nr:MAG: hypothetical protein Ct9H300mP9_2850 [Candidatus Neomarinimicrobiota bacterium]
MDHEDDSGNPWPSWAFYLNLHPDNIELIYNEPQPGDTAMIIVEKPFLHEDIYEFTTVSPFINKKLAKDDMQKIKVVPNPYYATTAFEGQNTSHPEEVQERSNSEICPKIASFVYLQFQVN